MTDAGLRHPKPFCGPVGCRAGESLPARWMSQTGGESLTEVHMGDMDLDGFAKALRKGAREFNRNLSRELHVAGERVAESARMESGSSKIAGSIRVLRRGYNLAITAGGKGVPEAALRERGNPGTSPTRTTFKHRVFGHDVWVEQPKHPFLLPAWEANKEKVLELMNEAMKDSFPGNEKDL